MQHPQIGRYKNAQPIRISQYYGCPGAFTYITAQIVKERSVFTSEDRHQQTNFRSADV